MSEFTSIINKIIETDYSERDILYQLMPYKVEKILLIAHLYDALSIEREGKLDDTVRGDYYKMNLSSAPEIVKAHSYDDALIKLEKGGFDLVIIMCGIDRRTPLNIAKKIKDKYTKLPLYLLVNNNTDINHYKKQAKKLQNINNIFVWNGDSNIFLTIVKLLEDKKNVANDTKIGLSRIILLVEDSEKYYSRYLPILYKSVMEQTQRIIDDSTATDDMYKIMKMRMRPKILLATDYDDAINIYDTYKDYILSVISDVKFKKNNRTNKKAGFILIKHIKKITPRIPTAIQSSDIANKITAETECQSRFIDKNSNSLIHDIKDFIKYNLGFGDFIFRANDGEIVDRAKDMDEFYRKLHTISDESLGYHAGKNHFSLWLRARGEITLAEKIAPYKISDFDGIQGIRKVLIQSFYDNKVEQNRGQIISVNDYTVLHESNIGKLATGALGGKGRGVAFMNSLIYKFNINKFVPGIKLKMPKTFIIGTDEYDNFLSQNDLFNKARNETNFSDLSDLFVDQEISSDLKDKLLKVLSIIKKPIAVRSSGLFEDSLMQPFAGIFSTYILPNNHNDINHRLKQVCTAVKLVFASVFSETSKNYINAVNYKIEEEKMAIVLQELVGNKYENVYYPHISGTAQSYNYYPFGKIKPHDGAAVAAVGLGIYVVEGEKAYRFSPNHPTLQNNSNKDLFKNSQTELFAVNLERDTIDFKTGETAGLIRLNISEPERLNFDRFKHCVSVYNPDNDMVYPGLDKYGPRIVNFANILKYNYIPLAKTIKTMLNILKEAMGAPVEIEYAVDLNLDEDREASFYLLQVKPLIGNSQDYNINFKTIDIKNAVLFSKNAMGNGVIEDVRDVIYVNPETFDKSKTEQIAKEIDVFNKKMISEGKSYVLIGPGRWGTRDKWIGIPVNWTQISKAKVIVETSLHDFPLEASSGSHFFHNVTSMNVGYFSIQHTDAEGYINWKELAEQELVEETDFIKHVRFSDNLRIQTDGKKRIAVIEKCQK
ncbi:MAG: pyruvate, phosphate dikinase [Bacteroidales bacterium]|nr:pyruvate, phosphate dikinase [Bacteroidales bacterium]